MAFDYAAKIQALLANADDEALSDAARQLYRDKADQLMDQYRIAEEDALATDPGSAKPIFKDIRVTKYNTLASRDLERYYTQVMRTIVRHAGCLMKLIWDDGYVATVCGYEGDVRYAEYLWTSALLVLVTRIDPVWDDTLPEGENIWRLRNAGIERRVIADRAWGYGAGKLAANRSKVQRVYLRECDTRGEMPRATGLGHQTQVYRDAYADAFATELSWRLQMARSAADRERGGLVLHGRMERVQDALWDRFPDMKPQPPKAAPEGAAVYVPCPKCAANKSGKCKDHPYSAVTVASERRWAARERSASRAAGTDAGRDAAARVDVVRGASGTRTGRVGGQDTPREIGG